MFVDVGTHRTTSFLILKKTGPLGPAGVDEPKGHAHVRNEYSEGGDKYGYYRGLRGAEGL